MTGRPALIALAALVTVFALPGAAQADGGIKVGWYSQQVRPSRAAVGADVHVSKAQTVERRSRGETPGSTQAVVVTVRAAHPAPNLPPPFPALSTSAPILRDQHPGGPGSFWYTDSAGHACQY